MKTYYYLVIRRQHCYGYYLISDLDGELRRYKKHCKDIHVPILFITTDESIVNLLIGAR